MRTNWQWIGVFVIGSAALLPAMTQRAVADEEDEEQPLVVRVYRVMDLVAPVPNYPYEGTFLPGMTRTPLGSSSSNALNAGATGGMGGGMGGGMMGGGMMRVIDDHLAQLGHAGTAQAAGAAGGGGQGGGAMVGGADVAGGGGMGGGRVMMAAPPPRPGTRISFGILMNAIISLIAPDSWDENGGPGAIYPIGGALGINQTVAVHKQIDEFLTALRQESCTLRTLSINAHWLNLDNDQLAKLDGAGEKKSANRAGGITRERLAALPPETRSANGRITCFSGQTVHLIAGRMETKLQGGIPVVGGGNGGVGYQPIIASPHLGTLLQITTSLLPGDDAALVDLHSSVTRWDRDGDPVKLVGTDDEGDTVVQVDRLNIEAQQLATSLRVSLGKPALVGGMTGAADAAGHDERLYLVIEISASDEKTTER